MENKENVFYFLNRKWPPCVCTAWGKHYIFLQIEANVSKIKRYYNLAIRYYVSFYWLPPPLFWCNIFYVLHRTGKNVNEKPQFGSDRARFGGWTIGRLKCQILACLTRGRHVGVPLWYIKPNFDQNGQI